MLFQMQILCNLNATNREALSFCFFPMIHALHALIFFQKWAPCLLERMRVFSRYTWNKRIRNQRKRLSKSFSTK